MNFEKEDLMGLKSESKIREYIKDELSQAMKPKISTKSPIDPSDYSVYHHKDFGPGFFNGFIIKENCH